MEYSFRNSDSSFKILRNLIFKADQDKTEYSLIQAGNIWLPMRKRLDPEKTSKTYLDTSIPVLDNRGAGKSARKWGIHE